MPEKDINEFTHDMLTKLLERTRVRRFTNNSALTAIGWALCCAKRFDESFEVFEKVDAIYHDDRTYNFLYDSIDQFAAGGEFDRAIALADKVYGRYSIFRKTSIFLHILLSALCKVNEQRTVLMDEHQRSDSLSQRIENLDKILDELDSNEDNSSAIASSLVDRLVYELRNSKYQYFVDINSPSFLPLFFFLSVLIRSGHFNDATRLFESLNTEDQKYATKTIVEHYLIINEKERAFDYIERAHSVSQRYNYLGMAAIHLAERDREKSLEIVKELEQILQEDNIKNRFSINMDLFGIFKKLHGKDELSYLVNAVRAIEFDQQYHYVFKELLTDREPAFLIDFAEQLEEKQQQIIFRSQAIRYLIAESDPRCISLLEKEIDYAQTGRTQDDIDESVSHICIAVFEGAGFCRSNEIYIEVITHANRLFESLTEGELKEYCLDSRQTAEKIREITLAAIEYGIDESKIKTATDECLGDLFLHSFEYRGRLGELSVPENIDAALAMLEINDGFCSQNISHGVVYKLIRHGRYNRALQTIKTMDFDDYTARALKTLILKDDLEDNELRSEIGEFATKMYEAVPDREYYYIHNKKSVYLLPYILCQVKLSKTAIDKAKLYGDEEVRDIMEEAIARGIGKSGDLTHEREFVRNIKGKQHQMFIQSLVLGELAINHCRH